MSKQIITNARKYRVRINAPKTITLREHQVEHCNAAAKILINSFFYIETSGTGTGKTFVSCELARRLGLKLFVVCPASVQSTWKTVCNDYNINLIDIFSYESLASKKNNQPKHGLLTRSEVEGRGGKLHPYFEATNKLWDLIDSGTFFVFDECQKIKNKGTGMFAASLAITLSVIGANGRSRFSLASATPLSDIKHYISMVTLAGTFGDEEVYHGNNKFNVAAGDHFMKFCNIYFPNEIKIMKEDMGSPNQVNIKKYIQRCLSECITPHFALSMGEYIDPKYKRFLNNGFFNMDEEDQKKLVDAVSRLNRSLGSDGNSDLTSITNDSVEVEKCKLPIFCDRTIRRLWDNPHDKVIIFLNYKQNFEALKEVFLSRKDDNNIPSMNIEYLDGNVSNNPTQRNKGRSDRDILVDRFNKGDINVLVSTISTGGTGLSFHDQVGDSPRYVLISPNYQFITSIQASGRTYRSGIMSDTHVTFVYAKGAAKESHILASYIKKSSALKGALGSSENRVMLPDKYPCIEENDKGEMVQIVRKEEEDEEDGSTTEEDDGLEFNVPVTEE